MLFCFNILKTHFSKLIHLLLLKNQSPNYFYGIDYNHFIFQQNEKRMIQELKAFLLRGDVLALAVAVIIAGAFGKIIDSLVNDIISPILGMITGNPDFSAIIVGGVKVGNFINAIVNFVIVGIVLFFLVKAAGKKGEDVK